MPRINAIGFDPGGTTGFCLSQLTDDKIYVAYSQRAMNELAFWRLLQELRPQIVVCESFEYRQAVATREGVDMFSPVRLIGVLNLWRQMHPEIKVYYQNAAKGKSYWGNKQLRDAKLYRTGVDHGRDAARHMLQWWMFQQGCKYWIGASKKPNFQLTTVEFLTARFNRENEEAKRIGNELRS